MNTRHSRRISRKAAGPLLDGATGLGTADAKAPAELDPLARVLAAAAAPGREHELADEQMAVAAFEANHLASDASSRRGQMIKSPLAKLLTTKVLAAGLTLFAGGGVALAASTGTFSGSAPAAAHSSAPAPSSAPSFAVPASRASRNVLPSTGSLSQIFASLPAKRS